jgi:hypothetical protein
MAAFETVRDVIVELDRQLLALQQLIVSGWLNDPDHLNAAFPAELKVDLHVARGALHNAIEAIADTYRPGASGPLGLEEPISV